MFSHFLVVRVPSLAPKTSTHCVLVFLFVRGRGDSNKAAAFMPQAKPQCNNDDRSLRLKQGGIVGAAF